MQEPHVLIDYVLHRNIMRHKDFQLIRKYVTQEEELNYLSKTFPAQVQRARPKYKLDVDIPKRIEHMLYFDQNNGNNLWREANE